MDKPPPYEATPSGTQTYVAYPVEQPPAHVTINHPQPSAIIVTSPNVIHVGRCPACHVGILTDNFTCLGIFCAIFFFPLGILCCFMLTEKRCSHCGIHFG